MVKITEIVDKNSLEIWLKEQPKEVSVWLAHRMAMRLVPIWWGLVMKSRFGPWDGLTALNVLCCNLISAVARVVKSPDIVRAAASAANALATNAATPNQTDGAADAAYTATYNATAHIPGAAATTNDARGFAFFATDDIANARAAQYASAEGFGDYRAIVTADIWNLFRLDCVAITSGVKLDRLPLWHGLENPLFEVWAKIKEQLLAASSSPNNDASREAEGIDWSFWIKWYDDALDGNPPNWDMLERIALIAPKDWDKGAEIVNPLIAAIVAEYEVEPSVDLTPQQALNRSAKAVTAQLEALRIFVEEEIQRIRSSNNISDEEREQVNARVIVLEGIVEKIKKMITALADGDCAPENALVVIEEQLPKVFEMADKLATQEPEIGATIVAMGEIVEHLTRRGVPGHIATAIAGIDIASRPIRKRIKRNNKTRE